MCVLCNLGSEIELKDIRPDDKMRAIFHREDGIFSGRELVVKEVQGSVIISTTGRRFNYNSTILRFLGESEQKFQAGDPVSVTLIGKVKGVYLRDGRYRYEVDIPTPHNSIPILSWKASELKRIKNPIS